MKENNSKVDLGKGFKRLYYVFSAIWCLYFFTKFVNFYDRCKPFEKNNPFCKSLSEYLIELLLVYLLLIPIYYFLKWIVAGFKK